MHTKRTAAPWCAMALATVLLATLGCGNPGDSPLSSGEVGKGETECSERPCSTEDTEVDAFALCQQLQDETVEIQPAGPASVISRDNWKSIDVLANMDYRSCHDAISEQLLDVGGTILWQFTSHEDSCDGGNTYGSIYTEDLKTVVAHIYDSDIYCDGWNADELAKNHKCDDGAEQYAQQKMAAFGFAFEELSSSLELRPPYAYSYIDVSGVLPDHGNREATVRVLTNIDSCNYARTSIRDLPLD